jgi:hypothetical protein
MNRRPDPSCGALIASGPPGTVAKGWSVTWTAAGSKGAGDDAVVGVAAVGAEEASTLATGAAVAECPALGAGLVGWPQAATATMAINAAAATRGMPAL